MAAPGAVAEVATGLETSVVRLAIRAVDGLVPEHLDAEDGRAISILPNSAHSISGQMCPGGKELLLSAAARARLLLY